MKIPAAKAAVDKEWEKLKKIPAWDLTKVRSKEEVDICHLKIAELEAKHQKYKGRVVLRGDIEKDDSGSYAVFTEQGSSASQMTGAKIMDIISRLLGCRGQAADAVSAYTQVKMEDAQKLFETSQVRKSRYLDSSTTTQVAQFIVQPFFPVFLLERNLYGHPLWEKSTKPGMPVSSSERRIILLGWK